MELTKEDLDKMQKELEAQQKTNAINQFISEAIEKALKNAKQKLH